MDECEDRAVFGEGDAGCRIRGGGEGGKNGDLADVREELGVDSGWGGRHGYGCVADFAMAIAGRGCGRVGLRRVEGAVPERGRGEVGDLEKLGLKVAVVFLARSGTCRHSSPHSTTLERRRHLGYASHTML